MRVTEVANEMPRTLEKVFVPLKKVSRDEIRRDGGLKKVRKTI